ncbi:Nitrilotriacetate monooxygenase component A/pristinamycin IIA synthase subunit A [Durotheca rogersii]|uniref:Nitrilotriacetate monooxygenase component A/pristinamycin IIA synthase subunit A n=1 Tax=Durotheca rogersii TaxID=419775 RepID=UPI0022202EB9|nr:Nitrilotriacetate monooxygenase component A/pristinamycin IIA synthase subunit A [Durotheca rogersii]KAI5861152.1 Nitrilotriacetate monooxygenase component A/pristinamycin IIA synthase subunit A [Durotheca rogersii]
MSDEVDGPRPKQWILNAFSMSTPGHLAPGLWSHPRNHASQYKDIEYWVNLAKILEEGKFHGLFIADVLSHYGVYKGNGNIDPSLPGAAQFPMNDPFLAVSAMAAATKHLSFGVTASTTYENPFLLARRFATLDHFTKGRVAWNVVTSHLEPAARNLGLPTQIEHDERYRIAEEFVDLTYQLWEGSWHDDAVVMDTETKQYTVPGRVRKINHEGHYFQSAGPLTTEPSIQRTPFLFQAGASRAGMAFATRHAECMFLPGMTPAAVRRTADEVRRLARESGRDPATIKLIAGMLVVVDETDALAEAKYAEYRRQADLEGAMALFGGWTGVDLDGWADDADFAFAGPGAIQSLIASWSATVPGTAGARWTKRRIAEELAVGGAHARAVGSPQTVADTLQAWVDKAGIDGFNLSYAVCPGDFEDVVRWLLPELRARGVFWADYAAATTRENYFQDGRGPRLRSDHPGSRHKWPAEAKEEKNVVPRSELRSPEGYSLPATVMAKPGAFLLVPQKLDWSGLFVGSQRRFAELDAAGWDALRKDDHKLHAVLLALGARGDGGELRWLYDPGLAQEAEKRVRELQLSADA